jgi:hypothetical protein
VPSPYGKLLRPACMGSSSELDDVGHLPGQSGQSLAASTSSGWKYVTSQSMNGSAMADQSDRNFASETMAQRLKSLRWRRLNFRSCQSAFASIPSKLWIISSTRTLPCRVMKVSSFFAVRSNSSVETRSEISISTAARLSPCKTACVVAHPSQVQGWRVIFPSSADRIASKRTPPSSGFSTTVVTPAAVAWSMR